MILVHIEKIKNLKKRKNFFQLFIFSNADLEELHAKQDDFEEATICGEDYYTRLKRLLGENKSGKFDWNTNGCNQRAAGGWATCNPPVLGKLNVLSSARNADAYYNLNKLKRFSDKERGTITTPAGATSRHCCPDTKKYKDFFKQIENVDEIKLTDLLKGAIVLCLPKSIKNMITKDYDWMPKPGKSNKPKRDIRNIAFDIFIKDIEDGRIVVEDGNIRGSIDEIYQQLYDRMVGLTSGNAPEDGDDDDVGEDVADTSEELTPKKKTAKTREKMVREITNELDTLESEFKEESSEFLNTEQTARKNINRKKPEERKLEKDINDLNKKLKNNNRDIQKTEEKINRLTKSGKGNDTNVTKLKKDIKIINRKNNNIKAELKSKIDKKRIIY